ncbi:3-carboxy-cis,cis-muconate cycloisomerase [Streptomyces sp. NPDC059256]|uniref:3-carboxy-cis,cis-muconate cycloisomerase n=1 Tax=Streptomyces sp. NPDC059256 TaxID=3346794 RepID=UPI003683F366
MTSTTTDPDEADLDTGLLAPVRAGSTAERETGDRAVLQALLDSEAALTRAWCTTGRIPAAAGPAVTAAARADRFDARSLALRARAGGNPVIPLVTDLVRAVAESAPEHAEHIHRGATSQDILDTALVLIAHRTLGSIAADLVRTGEELARLASAHRTTAMPGRTLTQHAVPTTFGLKAAGWRSLVLDAHDRLMHVQGSLPAQLGGAAGTLAACHVGKVRPSERDTVKQPGEAVAGDDVGLELVAAYAAELGLAAPALPWHTLRTPVADLAGALAFTAGALGKIAADVLVLSRTEIAEVTEGTRGSSSAMPHKQNPIRATLIASAARQVPSLSAVLFGSLTGEDERPAGAWHAEWGPLREALRLVGGAAHHTKELCAGLLVHPARMRANLDLTGGRVLSERLSTHLATELGRAGARELLDRASRRAADEHLNLLDALRREARGRAPGPELSIDEPSEPGSGPRPDVPRSTRQQPHPPRSPEDRAVAALPPDIDDPLGYLGSAAALTDRALERRPRQDRT